LATSKAAILVLLGGEDPPVSPLAKGGLEAWVLQPVCQAL